jgi:hypothetical protein
MNRKRTSVIVISILVGFFSLAVENTVANNVTQSSKYLIADSFRAIAAKGYDWNHIFENHSASGVVAKQRLKANPDYIYSIYQNMTNNQIQACVQRAWKDRGKVETQLPIPPAKSTRIRYRAYDQETKYTIEFWQNADTGFVETAYPVKIK